MLSFNAKHYEKLTILIELLLKKKNIKIYFINNHDRLLNYLPNHETFNLINIDHHHDLGYDDDNEDVSEITCANWVYKLYEWNKIDTYTWINNFNSKFPKNEKLKLINYDLELEYYDINLIPDINYVFICLSSPWIPPYYIPLFTTWVRLVGLEQNKAIEIDNGVYENEKNINNRF